VHPWPRHQPVLDGLLHAEVGAAGVAHRGDADAKRGLQVLRCLEEPIAEWRLQQAHRVDAAHDDMGVAVEEARQKALSVEINALVTVESLPDVLDPTILHHEVGHGRIGPGAVNDTGPGIQRACHAPEATSAGQLR
jgi:hypothetical protein